MIKLKNKFLKVQVDEKGAEIKSIIKDKHEYLWQGNPDIWDGQAPNLFPIIGRLKDKRYTYNDYEYSMMIHGFARHSVFQVIDQNSEYVSLGISSNESTYAEYPFDFDLMITYELMDNTIKKSFIVINNSFDSMYYEVGGHEGFNLNYTNTHAMQDYFIEFSNESVYTYTTDEDIMLNEELTKIDLDNNKLYLNPNVFKNDALILDSSKLKERHVFLSVSDNNRGVRVHFEDFDYLGIWTKPFETNYICIEPWSSLPDTNYIDHKLENKIGIRKLEAKRSEILEYKMEII